MDETNFKCVGILEPSTVTHLMYICEECESRFDLGDYVDVNYCPLCGCKGHPTYPDSDFKLKSLVSSFQKIFNKLRSK